MDYQGLIKKLPVPHDFQAPDKLEYEDLIAKPLTRDDLDEDLAGVNSSIETIQKTRGGSWPTEELEKEFDFLDLAWHEREFRDATSFAYVIYDKNSRYIGCFYLYPMGIRTVLTEQLMSKDVDASWWVTTEAFNEGYYEKLYKGLQSWLEASFPFANIYYSNKEIPS